jgi:threonine dehydratase
MEGALPRAGVEAAAAALRPFVRRTPVVETDGADFGLAPFPLTLKLESLQCSGSFKARGAFANLLLRKIPARGVVAASGGNHGAAVAYAARRRGVPARIFVPTISSPAKTARIRAYGAALEVVGETYADALAASETWAAAHGAATVHAYDSPQTLLGPGTMARELEQQAPGLETILVAVGGGGLVGGVAGWYEGRVRIVGVEPDTAPTLSRALEAGRPVDVEVGGIAADSLGARRVGELVFPVAREYVDRVVLVRDEAIREAQRRLWDVLRVVSEPGAAAPLAALLCGAYAAAPGESVGIVVSGGNTTAVDFDR